MSVETALLTNIIAARDFSLLVRQGLAHDDAWSEQIDALRFIKRHVEEYRETPSLESVVRACPKFEANESTESTETLAAKLHERNVKNEIRKSLLEVTGKDGQVWAKHDGYELMRMLNERMEALRQRINARLGAGAINWAKSTNERLAEYERRAKGEYGTAIPLFWPAIDDAVGGFHRGDYVNIEAATKIGKSWLGFIAGLTANNAGFRILHELAESTKPEATSRLDTLAFGISNRGIFTGTLDEGEYERYKAKLDELQAKDRADYVIKTPEDWHGGLTVAQVEADIDQYSPDVVIVDQFNLMRHNGSTHQDRADTSRALKLLAARKGVIIIVITQANGDFIKRRDRAEDDLDDGQIRELRPPKEGDYSETIAVRQDCTHMIALDAILFTDEATKKQRGKALVVVEISRTGGAGTEVPLEWCPNDGIIRPRQPTDVF